MIPEENHPLLRIAAALESIAASMERQSKPLLIAGKDENGNVTLSPLCCCRGAKSAGALAY